MQRWWHSFGGMLSLSLREGKKLRGRDMGGNCSHRKQPAPPDSRDTGAPAASGSWRKAQTPLGRPGGGACSLPAAEGEGASSAVLCASGGWVDAQTRAGRQAPSAGDRQQQPTRDREGFSRPLLRGDGTRARKETGRGMNHPAPLLPLGSRANPLLRSHSSQQAKPGLQLSLH